jgi:hypothetical protein
MNCDMLAAPRNLPRDGERSIMSEKESLSAMHLDRVLSGMVNTSTRRARVLTILATALVLVPAFAGATELGRISAAMAPGTWAQVTTPANNGIISEWFLSLGGSRDHSPAYDSNVAAWNTHTRQMMIVSASDPTGTANPSSPVFFYTDDANAWTSGAPAVGSGYHGYDGVAWDDANQVLYWRPGSYSSGTVGRYCVTNSPSYCAGKAGTWSLLPDPTPVGCYQIGIGLTWHASMSGGRLVCYDADSGVVALYREGDSAWTRLPNTYPTPGSSNACAEYSPVRRVTVFGCGGTNIWKMDDNQVVTKLASPPVPLVLSGTSGNHDMVAEPISGNFLVIAGTPGNPNGAMYMLDPTGTGTWTTLDSNLGGAGKICNVQHSPAMCSDDFYGAANPTYGVVMYWKWTDYSSSELWVYKHAASAPTPAPGSPSSLNVK